MRYALIQAERGVLPVERACHLLKVSASGYYAWQKRQRQPPALSDEAQTVAQITRVFAESRGTYGSPRVTAALRQRGMVCNRKRVARLMRVHQLVAKHHRRRRVKTTDSRHGLPIAPNRLNRQFSAQRPDEKWVADITYIDTAEGWLYLALVVDVFSRKVVGWAMDTHLLHYLGASSPSGSSERAQAPHIHHEALNFLFLGIFMAFHEHIVNVYIRRHHAFADIHDIGAATRKFTTLAQILFLF